MRSLVWVALVGMALVPAQVQTEESGAEVAATTGELIEPSEIPSVHNTFYKVPDGTVGWDVLGAMEITAETIAPLRTRFTTDFNDEVKALDGERVQVMGFIYPLEGGLAHDHFLLTAWPRSCPFCLPAGPSQMVEIFAPDPIGFTEGAVLIAGTFQVLEDDPTGLYYRIADAVEVDRFEDIRWTGQLPAEPQTVQ